MAIAPEPYSHTWRWDVQKFLRDNPGAVISDTPPANPVHNQIWWDSATGITAVWYQDVDSGQWVEVGNGMGGGGDPGVPDAPADGGEYVRINGVWRLARQSFNLAGKNQQTITVPTWGPSLATFSYSAVYPGTPGAQMLCRVSLDGTTYITASSYYWGGYFHTSAGAGTFTNLAWGGVAYFPMHSTVNVNSVGATGQFTLSLTRAATPYFNGKNSSTAYDSGNSVVNYEMLMCLAIAAPMTPIKTFSFYTSTGLWAEGSITAEWM